MTIWGDEASRNDIAVGTILAIRGAKVSDYGGKSLNVDSGNNSIIIDPVGEARHKQLSAWYRKETAGGKQVTTEKLTNVGESGLNAAAIPPCLF